MNQVEVWTPCDLTVIPNIGGKRIWAGQVATVPCVGDMFKVNDEYDDAIIERNYDPDKNLWTLFLETCDREDTLEAV